MSAKKILTELYQRRRARRAFRYFCEYAGELKPAQHHLYLIQKLQLMAERKLKRLMVFMPPGHAKSTYGNLLFVPFYMGCHPTHSVISASHTQEFSERFGRRARSLIESPTFKNLFGFSSSQSSRASGRFDTEKGGEYFAVGVGGSVTGRRADFVVIDDPLKGRVEADSQLMRDRIWEWYLADLRTRLKPDAGIVLIQTRWHDDDLAGRILKYHRDEEWDIVCLKAIAEENDPLGRDVGEALWPEWMSIDQLLVEKKIQSARNWSALYQQNPMPDEGAYFKEDWIRYYDKMPDLSSMKIYGASDYAISSNGGDYTVHGVIGVNANDDIFILDWWRGQTNTDVWVDVFLDLMNQYKPIMWAEEAGQISKSLGPFIQKRQQEKRIYGHREQFVSAIDKASRARAIQARMAMGKIYLPKNALWSHDLIAEIISFPAGKHDDQVDVLSLFGRMLDKMITGNDPGLRVKKENTFNDLFDRHLRAKRMARS